MTTTSLTRALIVDHDERVCRVLNRIISRMGMECSTALDFPSFKSLYDDNLPAVILLNRDFAGYNYTEFSRYLAECRSTSAIFLVCDDEDDDTLEFIDLGRTAGLKILGTIRKPIDVEVVKKMLADFWYDTAAQPLKKNSEFVTSLGMLQHTINLDPDQHAQHRLCFKYHTHYPYKQQSFIFSPRAQG